MRDSETRRRRDLDVDRWSGLFDLQCTSNDAKSRAHGTGTDPVDLHRESRSHIRSDPTGFVAISENVTIRLVSAAIHTSYIKDISGQADSSTSAGGRLP